MIFCFQTPFIFVIVTSVLTLIIISLNDMFVEFREDSNKKTPYECGFQPFDNNIQQFDIKYYIVALLFLIFDIETIFLIPFVSVISYANIFVFYNIFFFMMVLFVGLLYEWKNNFLDWE